MNTASEKTNQLSPRDRRNGRIGALIIVALIVLGLWLLFSHMLNNNSEPDLLPDVKSFIELFSSEYGEPITSTDLPDWDNGKRQQVITSTGKYIFYLYDDDFVVSVYRVEEDGTRTLIFGD